METISKNHIEDVPEDLALKLIALGSSELTNSNVSKTIITYNETSYQRDTLDPWTLPLIANLVI